MKQIVKKINKTISQISEGDGIINAVKSIKCNERISFIDELAVLGDGTQVYFFVNIYGPAKIGKNVLISSYVSIQGEGTVVGDNCRIGDFSFLPAGTTIEENVFIGQNVSICNDKNPKSGNKDWKKLPVTIKKNSSIGSGCVILPGLTIGENCMLGAGSVLTKDMPNDSTWVGNPAATINKTKKECLCS